MPKISYKEILNLKYNLAPNQLIVLDIPNKNTKLFKNFLARNLKHSDKGIEVGSINYISESNNFFIRAKALQLENFLPCLNDETIIPIRPQVFKDLKLKKGDLIISKDSNIGESIILDKNYPNYTLSGALYKIPINKNKLYLFAFLKHDYFRKQLNILVPKGSTISHAKTLFLDCKIPFPNQKNADDVIKYIELLTQAIINKEIAIKKKNLSISILIEKELLENQKIENFNYKFPNFSQLEKTNRLDTSLYAKDYKTINFILENYIGGFFYLEKKDFKGGNTPKENNRIFNTGDIKWITPTIISNYGILKYIETIAIKNNIYNIARDCLILINRGNKKDLAKSFFYDYNYLKEGQHNQGCYRVENKEKDMLIFLCCLLNSHFYRNLFSYLSVGSKMPEIKISNLNEIPFPIFPKLRQKKIISLYHNHINYANNLNLENFLEEDKKWNEKTGIVEIDKSIKTIKKMLNSALDKIINNEKVEINF